MFIHVPYSIFRHCIRSCLSGQDYASIRLLEFSSRIHNRPVTDYNHQSDDHHKHTDANGDICCCHCLMRVRDTAAAAWLLLANAL